MKTEHINTNTDTNTEILTETYTYYSPGTNLSSNQVSKYKTTSTGNYDATYTYTYDDNGNILSVSDGTNKTTYVYDSANQLLRENNQAAGTTTVWTYDNAGNILTRKEYAYTTGTVGTATDTVNYTYGNNNWRDQLTSYDGQTITYDQIGNPLTDGTWTYTWKHGRELASMTKGSTTWEYTYNADGLRTKRTDGTDTYDYIYLDGQLVQLTVNNDGTEVLMKFAYDADGVPLSITYKGIIYYYVTNLQGDVVGIVNQSGNLLVSYTYDAWGNILSTTGSNANALGKYNPLRYRGYVYDEGTGLYYLQSRYYDPEMGRFLNADGYTSTGQGLLGNNMFAYCGNNPVVRSDAAGSMFVIERGGISPQEHSGSRFFGAETYFTYTYHDEIVKIGNDRLPVSISVDSRSSEKFTVTGDSSKPVSVYNSYDFSNALPFSCGAGLKFNTYWSEYDVNLATNGIQIKSTLIMDKNQCSKAISFDPATLSAKVEWSVVGVSDTTTAGTYLTVDVDMLFVAMLFVRVPVGQGGPQLAPVSGY